MQYSERTERVIGQVKLLNSPLRRIGSDGAVLLIISLYKHLITCTFLKYHPSFNIYDEDESNQPGSWNSSHCTEQRPKRNFFRMDSTLESHYMMCKSGSFVSKTLACTKSVLMKMIELLCCSPVTGDNVAVVSTLVPLRARIGPHMLRNTNLRRHSSTRLLAHDCTVQRERGVL